MDYPFRAIEFPSVRVTGGFWHERQGVNRAVTLPLTLAHCEDSARLENFDHAAEVMRRRAAGEPSFQIAPRTIYPFDDTDAYKVIEGASYLLASQPDAALERRLDSWIARIAAAQEPDGYLYTFRTMHPDSPAHEWCGEARWTSDPELSHELYNSGHLFEAGIAHYAATGKRSLLDVCLKNAELLWREFGDGRNRVAPGHPIIELALVKLARVTGDERWLQLARVFLDVRGPGGNPMYQQHARVVDQAEAVGHAVRAGYLYAGMADVGVLGGDARYSDAAVRIWENVAWKKLSLTGGVGARPDGEAFGANYELPDGSYNETCAAISLMMWCHRLFLLSGQGRYMDVFERAAFNAFPSGVSLAGDRFFYSNPLAHDGCSKTNHGHAGRAHWFGCACCPPNVLRQLASFSGYFYATGVDSIYVNVYAQSVASIPLANAKVELEQTTDYPWTGAVTIRVTPESPLRFALRLRIPGFARGEPVPSDLYRYTSPELAGWSLRLNGQPLRAPLDQGYAVIEREWRAGDQVELVFEMPVQRVVSHAQVEANRGRVAFERGPIVYCLEPLDTAPRSAAPGHLVPAAGARELAGLTLLRLESADESGFELVPYLGWNNRGLHPMSVWLEDPAAR
ncbi:MAG: glycoside hydrolase family 127 protein [Polyangiaceae bacterium]